MPSFNLLKRPAEGNFFLFKLSRHKTFVVERPAEQRTSCLKSINFFKIFPLETSKLLCRKTCQYGIANCANVFHDFQRTFFPKYSKVKKLPEFV